MTEFKIEAGKYRKKPVVIEAFRWNGKNHDVPDWARHHNRLDFPDGRPRDYEDGFYPPDKRLCVLTLEGRMMANEGDWIIRGIKGEVYPCKPDIFEMTYEKVDA